MRKVMILMLALVAVASAKAIISTIDAPDTNISGLAWGNGYLWAMDSVSDYVFQMDPATGAVLSSFYFSHPVQQLPTGLGYSETQNKIYLGSWFSTTGYVYICSPDGTVTGMVDMCGG